MSSDNTFLKYSYDIAKESDDPKAKTNKNSAVGCVIALNDKVLVTSANILPEQVINSSLINKTLEENRYHFIEHAERAAIYKALNSSINLSGATAYCTRFPCSDCARALIAANITRLVLPEVAKAEPTDSTWIESQNAAKTLFTESNISIDFIDLENSN